MEVRDERLDKSGQVWSTAARKLEVHHETVDNTCYYNVKCDVYFLPREDFA